MKSRFYHALSLTLILAFVAALFIPLHTPATAQDDPPQSTSVAEEDPTFALEWMQTLYDLVQIEKVDAPNAARIYGYAGITLYESLVNGMPGNYSLIGQLPSLPDLSYPDEGVVYDWPAVAIQSLATVIQALMPAESTTAAQTTATIDSLRERHLQDRTALKGEEVVAASVEYGTLLGEELTAWIAEDGYTQVVADNPLYELRAGDEWLWVKTNPDLPIVEPFWGQIRTFALTYADQCAVWDYVPFSTDPNSTFYKQALEVKETGDNLTEEQGLIARYWIDTPGETGTPAGHWIMIENQLVEQLNLRLDQAAGMYALVGVALADSFISAWSLKYQTLLLRPETYIQRHISRRWLPYLQTPNFPEYPSGHSVVSAAAAEVLTELFGAQAFTDRSKVSLGLGERAFTTFEQAAAEAAISRLYGGIHYRTGIENGMRQGRCVGQNVVNSVRLRPVAQGE